MYILPQVYLKDKNPENHWAGHSLMKPMNVDELFNKRVITSELEARLNYDDGIDASGITKGQTETKVLAEVLKNKTYQCVEWAKKLKLILFLKDNLKNQV